MAIDLAVAKRFPEGFTLDIHFRMEQGRLGILGASGSGKSMTLRSLAGIERPDHGRIRLNDRLLFDAETRVNLPPQRRRVGYLFQSYALFPTMSVARNIALALPVTGRESRRRVREYLERFGLEGLGDRLPHQLSGGQQQRVAIARLLAAEPEAVLLDEPFSALDSHLRERMELELQDILRDRDDVILVTHSRDVAYRFCSHILVIDAGRVLGFGPARDLFRNPRQVAVARLTGCKNISRIERTGRHDFIATDWGLTLRSGEPVPEWASHAGIRAHDFLPVRDGEHPAGSADGDNVFPIQVVKETEDVFEWNVIVSRAGHESDHASGREPLWWKYSKYLRTDIPARLRVPPEAIMFLHEGNHCLGDR